MAEPKNIHEFGEQGCKFVTDFKKLEMSDLVRGYLLLNNSLIFFIFSHSGHQALRQRSLKLSTTLVRLGLSMLQTQRIVMVEPKSIYGLMDQGNKFVQPSKQLEDLELVRGYSSCSLKPPPHLNIFSHTELQALELRSRKTSMNLVKLVLSMSQTLGHWRNQKW